MTFIELTEGEFDQQYRAVSNHLNPHAPWDQGHATGCLYETYGEEFIKALDHRRVWTLVDNNDGTMNVVSGRRWINRLGYLQDYFALVKFMADGQGDLRDLARKIRVLIEENLRMRFPDIFGSNEWLGDFLDKIRNANPGDVAYGMKSQLTELDDLNDFSKKCHHGNPAASREPITDSALRAYASRTLKFLRGQP